MRGLALICASLIFGLLAACSTQNQTTYNTAQYIPPPQTYTTSFGCQDGNSPVQNAVCENQQLASLDVQMASIFRAHLSTANIFMRDQLLASQRSWLLDLASNCNVTTASSPTREPIVSCLTTAYEARITSLTNWPSVGDYTNTSSGAPNAIAKYVQYKLLDAKQPALCNTLADDAASAMSADGSLDPSQLEGAQEIAGSHGNGAGTDLQGRNINVDLYRADLYGGYQIRARSVTLSGLAAPILTPTSVGDYVQTLPNGSGRFVSFASQTNDYGDIDVFTLGGQTVALATDTIGYNSPAPPGEAAVAALFTITQTSAAPACLFETYLMPPPISMGTFSQQPSLTPFLATLDILRSQAPVNLAPSDRQDSSYFSDETRWILFNMPLVVLSEAKQGGWTGWLRYRHDLVLDALFAWSQQNPSNQAAFSKLFTLLQPAAQDLDTIYVQQQGLTSNDAEQATALAMMELLYQATTYLSPGLGAGPALPGNYRGYRPRYPILASPQS